MDRIKNSSNLRKQMENAVRESEQKYRTLAENAKDGIYIISVSKKVFEYVNPAFEQITGYTSEKIHRENYDIFNLIHPEDAELIRKKQQARESGEKQPWIYEFRIIDRKGAIKRYQR